MTYAESLTRFGKFIATTKKIIFKTGNSKFDAFEIGDYFVLNLQDKRVFQIIEIKTYGCVVGKHKNKEGHSYTYVMSPSLITKVSEEDIERNHLEKPNFNDTDITSCYTRDYYSNFSFENGKKVIEI